MKQYQELLKYILENGTKTEDRTGVGTLSIFGYQMRFDLRKGFPLVTTKRVPFRWVAEELLWFLSGDTYEPNLRARGVDIWKEWATKEECAKFWRKEGDLGPIYGHQWRNFGADINARSSYGYFDNGIDQIKNLINQIKANPNSRRLIVSAWNPPEVDQVSLPPCHTLFQFSVKNNELSCQLYQRSADTFLGVPFNIASYALLTYMIAETCGLNVGEFIHTFGDAHIYLSHLEQVKELLMREPYPLPTLTINRKDNIDNYIYQDFKLLDYKYHPAIKADVAV